LTARGMEKIRKEEGKEGPRGVYLGGRSFDEKGDSGGGEPGNSVGGAGREDVMRRSGSEKLTFQVLEELGKGEGGGG